MNLERVDIPVKAEIIGHIGDFPISNAMLGTSIIFVLMLVLCIPIGITAKRYGVPGKLQALVEMILESLIDFIAKITGDEHVAIRILPIVGTLVVFIAFSNLISTVFPLFGSFKIGDTSLLRLPTNDFNMTFSIALGMVALTHVYGIRKFNLWQHVNKFIRIDNVIQGFRQGAANGFLAVIEMFVGFLDLVSEFAKIISLSLRLFGNIFAGEILLMVIMSLIAVIVPVPLVLMGLLTGFLQAIVFGALVSSYFALMVKED